MQIGLEGRLFLILIHIPTKYIKCFWKGQSYQLICLCFKHCSTPKVSSKLIKVLISLLRRLWATCISVTCNRAIHGSVRNFVTQKLKFFQFLDIAGQSNAINSRFSKSTKFSRESSLVSGSQRRTAMLVKPPEFIKQEIPLEILITIYNSERLEAFYQGHIIGAAWSKSKTEKHINILKLKAAKTATRQSPKCSNRPKRFT